MRVDPKTLGATVEKYNLFCDAGYDEEFLKEPTFLLPLRTPPFYAVLGRQGFDTTVGGIKVNHHMQVINKQNMPIRGLYATGDCAGGWEFANYNLKHPGSAMTFALCSGYLAGEHAAKYLKDN
jgi:fumarate reductase flavoprotein subunit